MLIDGINLINKLEKYRDNNIIILGHDNVDLDSIVSGYLLEKILVSEGYKASFVILDKEISNESLEICKQYKFDPTKYQRKIDGNKFILVDHNERMVEGEIIAIIDHHLTSKVNKCNLYFNKLISSTTLYICENNEKYFNKEDLRLAILALMLDTASFHSTKTRDIDKEWVINCCNKYDINYDELYRSGIYLTILDDLNKVSLNGLKKYKYGSYLVESSYIQIDDDTSNIEKINKIINILEEYVKQNNLEMFVFIVHDMINFKTKVHKITRNNIIEINYEKYTSRGSTIMPSIEKEILNK